jgi:TolB-like protein
MRNKKVFVFLAALMLVASVSLWAQQLTVAVSTFEGRGGLSKDEADAITELFISALVSDGTVKVVDRKSFDTIMAEMKFQASDWTNSDKVAQLGKALNANSIIQGSVMTLAGQSAITTTILDLNTAQIISSSTLRMNGLNEVFDKLPAFVKDLMGNLPKPRVTEEYKIGQKGPAGGIVFFDKGDYSNGWQYLEAAPLELEFTATWGAYRNSVQGTNTAVGTGKRNTQFINEFLMNTMKETMKASQICNTLNFNGYRDWFLPSIDELALMYTNLKQKGLGNFSDNYYWSSSQYDYYGAWYLNFARGSKSYGNSDSRDNKAYTFSVRAVRAF